LELLSVFWTRTVVKLAPINSILERDHLPLLVIKSSAITIF